MARKITERERLLTFAMTVTEQELREALETIKVILATRFGGKKERRRREAKPESPNNARVMPISEAKAAG